jgi:hypothetical protein
MIGGIEMGASGPGKLTEPRQAGMAVGIGLSMVSGLVYTAHWMRIYEARGPERG